MNFKEMRENQGFTMKEIAQMLDVSENYLWMIESGKRKMSKLLQEKFNNIVEKLSNNESRVGSIDVGDIHNSNNSVVNIQTSQPPSEDLAVVPTETLTEHIEVVQANNELLQEVRETQEKELRLKREQGRQLSEVLEFVQGLDEMMQKRVREIIDERTRTIIAATNHHIHTQAQVMITAIEGIINMVEAGVTNSDLFLRQLRAVRSQLEKMADFKQ
jgi:transcriptional regulator with XRE-family HTH domain